MPAETPKVKSIEALRRGIEVLEAIRAGGGLSLHALHGRTALPKATLLRILRTLEESGVVQRRIADGFYLPRADTLAPPAARREHLRLTELAAPHLRALRRQLPWPSDIAVRDGAHMLVLESNRPLSGLSVNRQVVGFRPHMLLSAMGRAYFAFCPADERAALLRELAREAEQAPALAALLRPAAVERLLADARRRGYGLRDPVHRGPDADMAERFCAIAVPIQLGSGSGS
ncbi:MAG: helix-turn-helix domain-containing protein, partial [Burkholderiaceae bacterium]